MEKQEIKNGECSSIGERITGLEDGLSWFFVCLGLFFVWAGKRVQMVVFYCKLRHGEIMEEEGEEKTGFGSFTFTRVQCRASSWL